jgi:hypothetical protein
LTTTAAHADALVTGAHGQRQRLRPGWPLRVLFYGYPLWWVLGCAEPMFLAMAVAMTFALFHRPVRVPRGFGIWLLFLVWVLASVFVLWSDAPGTVPVHGPSRLFIFSYRLIWYAALTVVLLYVGNLREDEMSKRQITRLLGYMFVVTVVGGLVGVLMPHIQFKSVAEFVLPRGLTSNAFVHQIIHPRVAEVQEIVGSPMPRPTAPYYYTNSWGANFSLFLPFFLLAWRDRRAGWRRTAAPFVLLAAFVPVVFSLNRALWLALIVMALFVALRLAMQGRVWAVRGLVGAVVVGSVVFFASPLHTIVDKRLQHGHSNERRGDLATTTFTTSFDASPIIGFGGTRRAESNFSSIAGGARPDCPVCAAPPLGTQGHLWLLIISQGVVGAGLFMAFFVRRFVRHWRDASAYALAGSAVVVAAAVEVPFYDLLGAPLFTVMIVLGLLWRAEADRVQERAVPGDRLPARRARRSASPRWAS